MDHEEFDTADSPSIPRRFITLTKVTTTSVALCIIAVVVSLLVAMAVLWTSRNEARDDLSALQSEQRCRAIIASQVQDNLGDEVDIILNIIEGLARKNDQLTKEALASIPAIRDQYAKTREAYLKAAATGCNDADESKTVPAEVTTTVKP